MPSSPYIRAMHPKSEILPEPQSVQRILDAGWIGQTKIHGHRAQLHISADESEKIVAYTRQGKLHSKKLSDGMTRELRRLFTPKKGWHAIDAEWLKDEDKLFVFDFLKFENEVLRLRTFPDRWALLPRAFISPRLSILPLLRDLPSCLKVLNSADPSVEGLVFKSATSLGFADTSIVRCRRK